VHPEKEKSLGYIEDFFENLEQYTSDGKKGTRKCMWIGPAGTGKTSLSRQILREYGKTICVCITTDLKACYLHMVKAAKSKRPTIIILEDAEKSLQGANSDVLNVLDGVDLPRNVAGTYIIMTTNKPNMIEKRILKRPGRIDEYCFWGMLYDEDALKCAKLYFKDSLYQNKTDEEIIMIDAELLVIVSNEGKGMSGAQIQNLAESMVSYSKSRGVKITTELIKEAKREIEDNLAKIEKMSDEQGLLKEDSMGFNLGERKEESAGFRTY
jgi:ATP-dependent 26S proteasome regulatory subunit